MTRPPAVLSAAAVLVALLAATPHVGCGQEPVRFRHLTMADGLSQNAVTAIAQDRRGFMWLGTRDGLDRYDGYEFVVFRHAPSDSLSLPANEITALLEDGRGRLWVGTRSGVSRFDPQQETFARFPSGPKGAITAIAEDRGGNVWIGTESQGLFQLLAGADTAFRRFGHDAANPSSPASDRIFALLVDHRGALWVGTDQGVDRLGPATSPQGGFSHYRADATAPTGLIDAGSTALYEDGAGRVWVGSVPGVTVFNADRTRTQRYYHHYRTYRYGWGLANSLVEDPSGRIWIATRSELMILDPETGTFRYVQPPRDAAPPQGGHHETHRTDRGLRPARALRQSAHQAAASATVGSSSDSAATRSPTASGSGVSLPASQFPIAGSRVHSASHDVRAG